MEQEDNKVVGFGQKFSEKASEIGNKVGNAAKVTFDQLNFLKDITEADKTISNNEKEKALKIIEIIKDIDDDDLKAETLKDFVKGNNSKEIIEKIIYAVKHLSIFFAVIVVALLAKQSKN